MDSGEVGEKNMQGKLVEKKGEVSSGENVEKIFIKRGAELSNKVLIEQNLTKNDYVEFRLSRNSPIKVEIKKIEGSPVQHTKEIFQEYGLFGIKI